MTISTAPNLDQYWRALSDATPTFSPDEQRVAVGLYRQLAKGAPVSVDQLAKALGASPTSVREHLSREPLKPFSYLDDRERVLGFGGLAAAPMHHRFEVDGTQLWTWCAWDALFIPELLDETARVESPDPRTGTIVRLTVAPDGVISAQPTSAVVSFLLPDASEFMKSAANVMASFCHFVFFFESRESGERWAAEHEGTFLYSLEDAFELAQRLNRKAFPRELHRNE